MSISTAVSLERISRTVGYAIKKGNFATSTPYLPQRVAILGEANTANQSGLTVAPFEFTTVKEVGDKFGYGSPLHQIARILRPVNGSGLGGIPTIIYPQLSDAGATATVIKGGITGTATKNATHFLIVSGRDGVDGTRYTINIASGDLAAAVEAKIILAINGVLGAPCTAADNAGDIDFTSKWEGVTSAELNITYDTNGDAAGLVYAEISKTAGTGAISLAASLALFGNEWNTIIVNPYSDTTNLAALEAFNGVPDETTPTGRYVGEIFKPFVALFGSVLDTKAALIAITDAAGRLSQVTNVLCPAPGSSAFSWEAAANVCLLLAPTLQNTPHLDANAKSYADMPIPLDGDIADMAIYDNRDYLAKRGCSTVTLTNGRYTIQDLITTYHPAGETPPQFKYVRNLNIDWNVRYKYYLLELINVIDHAIAESDQAVRVANVIKPIQWKQIINTLADTLASDVLISDVDFTKSTIVVGTSETNPDRLETSFSYKRSSYVRIASTTVEAGFAFGIR